MPDLESFDYFFIGVFKRKMGLAIKQVIFIEHEIVLFQ